MQVIRQGENKYLIRVFLGRDAKGKRIFHSRTINATRKKAVAYGRDIETKRDTGQVILEPTLVTVSEYLDSWMVYVREQIRASTLQVYFNHLKNYIRPALGKRRLAHLTPLDVQAHYSDLLRSGISASTISTTHRIFRAAINQAVRWRMITLNPLDGVRPPTPVKKEVQTFTPDEALSFLEATTKHKYGVMLALLLTTGLRPEEVIGLQWKYLDLDRKVVHVRRTIVWPQKGGKWYFSTPKTKSGVRSVYFPAPVAKRLAQHRRDQLEQKMKAQKYWEDNDLVFCNRLGQPLRHDVLTKEHFKRVLKLAGLPQTFTLYALRHTYATLSLTEGVPVKVVSAQLGHANIALTLNTYAHVLEHHKESASDKLEKLLFSGSVTQ